MFDVSEMLVGDETQLANYQVHIAHQTDNGWSMTIPILDAVITTERLILRPQTFRPYPPASIPVNYISGIRRVKLDLHKGVWISVKPNFELYLVVNWSSGGDFVETLESLLVPQDNSHFTRVLDYSRLRKLINYVKTI
ncbi:MAG: hypothetical protein D6737_05535 [Chloroflexi bacterium]|nr:MAG: hypothetical protein D6737_05535 [Chloroflexota bacterium]